MANKFIPNTCVDITNWVYREDIAWKGTRDKGIFEDPNGDVHYFKLSHERYPWEFWSEIVASKLGQQLGLDTVDYNVGYRHTENNDIQIGCISNSMIDLRGGQSLVHGIEILRPFKEDFDEKKGTDHSFQLIERVFEHYKEYSEFLSKLLEIIVFDAIIGNRDRHQENWGIIRSIVTLPKNYVSIAERIIQLLRGKLKGPKPRVVITISDEFSPIYDSGSSLAHNVLDKNIEQYLTGAGSEQKFDKYAFGKKAQCHIRWNEELLTFYEIIEKLKEGYGKDLKEIFKRIHSQYRKLETREMIYSIDNGFPFEDTEFALTENRKELIFKLIDARMSYLERQLLRV